MILVDQKEDQEPELTVAQAATGLACMALICSACFVAGLLIGGLPDDAEPLMTHDEDGTLESSPGDVAIVNGIDMVWCPPGGFAMGPDKGETLNGEEPTESWHAIQIDAGFWMSTCEITKWQWLQVMGTRPWASRPSVLDRPDTPAVFVNYYDAQAFCKHFSLATGLAWRLPREDEWEYAARAGSTKRLCFADDSRIHSSDVASCDAYMWHFENHLQNVLWAQGVGQLEPNSWGLHDVLGNTQEWCADACEGEEDEPGVEAPVRGGCWRDVPSSIAVWRSQRIERRRSDPYTGFRVLLEACSPGDATEGWLAPGPSEEEWAAMRKGTNGFDHWFLPGFDAHQEPISAINISPDGAYLATTAWDNTVKLWNVEDQRKVAECDVTMIWHMVRVSPGGRYVVLNNAFELLESVLGGPPEITLVDVWDVQTGTRLAQFDTDCQDIRFSLDGRYLALLSIRSLEIYETDSWQLARSITVGDPQAPEMSPVAIGFAKDGATATVLTPYDHYTYRVEDGACVGESHVEPNSSAVEHAALLVGDPARTIVIADSTVTSYRFWPERSETLAPFASPFSFGTGASCYTPDGRYLVQVCESGWIDVATVPFCAPVKRYPVWAEDLIATPDGKHIVAHNGRHVFMTTIEGPPKVAYFRDNPDFPVQDVEVDGEEAEQ
jgi:formylglycine-generating enzyme required for sulfatase activity